MSEVLDSVGFFKDEAIYGVSGFTWKYCSNNADETTGRSPATVRRYLKALRESGFVEKIGNTANVVYIVKNN